MKKIILLSTTLFCSAIYSMYHPTYTGQKLKHSEVKLTNQSLIPLEVTWTEIMLWSGRQQQLSQEIKPDETITVKLGEVGGYFRENPAKIIYKPVPGNEDFKQEFIIDLPSSEAFVFTASTLSEILSNVWVLGFFKADEKGKLSTFQYMNMQDPRQWESAMLATGRGLRKSAHGLGWQWADI